MNGYIALHNGKRAEIHANTSYEAQKKAIDLFKVSPKKSHMVTVHLCEKEGEQVTQSTQFV